MGARPMAMSSRSAVTAPSQAMHSPVRGAVASRPMTRTVSGVTHGTALRSGARPVATRGVVRTHPTRPIPNSQAPTQTANAEDAYGTPGLGFDYAHYAAVHPYFGRRRDRGGSVVPFIGGGIYLPTTGYIDSGVGAEPDEEGSADNSAPAPDNMEAAPVQEAPAIPRAWSRSNAAVAPSPEYIFVRRDGTVFFAVAYSWVNGNLQYVTQDGLRKLASQSTLDLDATAQFNEQRGVSFHSPA
jgi:hypothetical protein